MLVAKPMKTLFAAHFQRSADLSSQTKEEKYMSRVSYASTVESIMYVMVCTHPDISYAVSVVSLEKGYWQTMKWIL